MGIALLLALFSHRAAVGSYPPPCRDHRARVPDEGPIHPDRRGAARTRSASSTGVSTTCWPRSRTGRKTVIGPWRPSARARRSTGRSWSRRRTASSSSRTSGSRTSTRAWSAMSESSREELVGTLFIQHVAEEEVAKLARYYENRMKGIESASMYETVFKTKNGHLHPRRGERGQDPVPGEAGGPGHHPEHQRAQEGRGGDPQAQ